MDTFQSANRGLGGCYLWIHTGGVIDVHWLSHRFVNKEETISVVAYCVVYSADTSGVRHHIVTSNVQRNSLQSWCLWLTIFFSLTNTHTGTRVWYLYEMRCCRQMLVYRARVLPRFTCHWTELLENFPTALSNSCNLKEDDCWHTQSVVSLSVWCCFAMSLDVAGVNELNWWDLEGNMQSGPNLIWLFNKKTFDTNLRWL